MKTNLYQIRLSEKRRRKKSLPRPGVEPESSRPQRDVLTTRPSKHLPTVLLLFFFFFHKVLSLEVTPWRVLPGSLLYNWDKTSPKGEGLRYDAIDNRSDRVYRNTWCNDGRQRTSSRTKDTFGNPYRIWRWKRVSAFYYMDWENLGPSSFLMTSWMGDTPIPPLTSYYVTSRVLKWSVFKWRLPWWWFASETWMTQKVLEKSGDWRECWPLILHETIDLAETQLCCVSDV